MTALGSSASVDPRSVFVAEVCGDLDGPWSLALESTATGAAVVTGVSGVTMTAGRASPAGVLAVGAGRDWLAGACATGGTAGARRRSATRSHAAVAV